MTDVSRLVVVEYPYVLSVGGCGARLVLDDEVGRHGGIGGIDYIGV